MSATFGRNDSTSPSNGSSNRASASAIRPHPIEPSISSQASNKKRNLTDNGDSVQNSSSRAKRVKLDSLLQQLSLGDEQDSNKHDSKAEPTSPKLSSRATFSPDSKSSSENENSISFTKARNHPFIARRSTSPKPQSEQGSFTINSSLKLNKYSIMKPTASPNSPGSSSTASSAYSSLDSYITDKIIQHFQHAIQSGNSLIHWYRPYYLIVYHFQRWVVVLFNRFLKKYQRRQQEEQGLPPTRFRPFRFYHKIMNLVSSRDINFTYQDLANIIFQENKLEMARLQKKRRLKNATKASAIDEDDDDFDLKDIKYNYWDRLSNLNKDLDMDPSDSMDFDEYAPTAHHLYTHNNGEHEHAKGNWSSDGSGVPGTGPIESNYGSYYYDYRGATSGGTQTTSINDDDMLDD